MSDNNINRELSNEELSSLTEVRGGSGRPDAMIRVECEACGENFLAMKGEKVSCPKCETQMIAG